MNHIASRPSPTVRRTRRAGVLAGLAVLALTVAAGCSDDEKRGFGEEDARDSLSGQVEQVVADQGLELDGDLECTASIDEAGTLTSSCTGTATSGEAIAGDYTGTADIDAETCAAHLVVTVDAATVADQDAVDCFAVS